MTDPQSAPPSIYPHSSYIGRLLAAADAALAEPQPDFVLPAFPWLPRTISDDARVQRNRDAVTVQAEDFCA